MPGNVYISGWSAIGTTRRLIGLKYTAALTPLWEYSEPIGSNPFTAGEVIPEGGMYLIREGRGSDPKLLRISGDGVKLWETVVPEDYHYYKGVDKDGNFYGATWAEENDWAVTVGKYAYENGAVLWSLPELFSGETDDILADAQGRLYTFGSLMDPVGDDELFVARYGGDTVAPAAVSDLAVTVVSSDSITLSWTAPGDDSNDGTAAAYDLRYTTAGAMTADEAFNAAARAQGVTVPQAAGTAETFTIIGLMPGTTYFFAIKTADEAGNVSGLSNSPAGMILLVDTTASAAVTDLAATAVSSNTVTLAWTAPGDDGIVGTASSYDIRYTTAGVIASTADYNFATQAQGEPAPQIAGSTETFTVTGLAPGTTYFFGIRTADEAGNISGLSNCVFTGTCVEVTGVPNWKQFRDGTNTWWDDDYDHTTKKISTLGCFLTAAAQVAKKHGFNTDPGKLNAMLKKTAGGFDGKNLDPEVMVATITAQGIALNYKRVYGTNAKLMSLLEDSLHSGEPVILQLYSASIVGGSHFVVATKKCNNTISINDPGHNNSVTTLDQYFSLITNGNPKTIRSIRKIMKRASL